MPNNLPNNLKAMIDSARSLFQNNQLDEAKEILQEILKEHPKLSEAKNHLGIILYRQKNYEEAEKCFIQALKEIPDHFNAMYNLALVYKAQNKQREAIACAMAILAADEKQARALFLLAQMLIEEDRQDEANYYFTKILAYHYHDEALLLSVIEYLLKNNHYKLAQPFCERLIELQPSHIELLYNLGVIESRQRHVQKAQQYYLKALDINPQHFASINNLAVLYLEEGNIESAKFYFERALKEQPNNESIHYHLGVLTGGEKFKEAPAAYLKQLFDQYADHFEQHLCEGLEYDVPIRLKQAIESHRVFQKNDAHILDLGCGTGLCSAVLRPWAKQLIGVDISSKMIEQARKKQRYDELYDMENTAYLSGKKDEFDLIIAADVFVYQGDLKPIIKACSKALKSRGILAFTVEIGKGSHFALQKTGRFSHSKEYVIQLAKELHLKLLLCKMDKTRIQREQMVVGYYFVFEKNKDMLYR